jgi:hypothetical protein
MMNQKIINNIERVVGNKKGRRTILISALLILTIIIAANNLVVNNVSAATSPSLGVASTFAVLGASAVTDVPTSAITGNVGLSPAAGTFYSGLTCAEVTGIVYQVSAGGPSPCAVNNPVLLTTAHTDENNARLNLAGQVCNFNYGGITQDLAGMTLVPGVYCATAFALSGTLTLSGSGVWIFQTSAAAAALTTTPGGAAKVQFLNGIGSSCDVWWQVASSATIGSGTTFIGNILALTSISLGTGATLDGRALVHTAAVTLDTNKINAPNCVPGTNTITTTIITSFSGTVTTVTETIVAATTTTASAVGGYLQPINKAEVLSTALSGAASSYWWVLVIAAIMALAAVLLMRRSSSSIKDEPNVKDDSFDGIW